METRVITQTKKNLNSIVTALKEGKLVVYPTETSYGIACDATNTESIKKIYDLKGREFHKPLSIIVSDFEMVKNYIEVNSNIEKLVEKFMPGPLTLIVKKKNLPDELSKETIAFRISSNDFATRIVKGLEKPITATSANIAGEGSIYKINEIKSQFEGKVDIIIDSGNLEKKKPSTIFDIDSNEILREGEITKDQLFHVLEE